MADMEKELQSRVLQAIEDSGKLNIQGGNSKVFYGPPRQGEILSLQGHSGIVSYEPSELVVTVRAGTPLKELEQVLAEKGQMLPFEPPHFNDHATIGGAIAAGLSGPRRPWGGSPRDLLLGAKILDGKGQILSFGGQVMKNVAGYDLSRPMAGSMGSLGILLEVSLKVLPKPQQEHTLKVSMNGLEALKQMRRLAGTPTPLSGACHLDGDLYLRLACSEASLKLQHQALGGEVVDGESFWKELRDQKLPFFNRDRTLWRLSLAPSTALFMTEQDSIIDWGGYQRWVFDDEPATCIRLTLNDVGGHGEQFRNADTKFEIFHPLDGVKYGLHQRLLQVFDPHNIFSGNLWSRI